MLRYGLVLFISVVAGCSGSMNADEGGSGSGENGGATGGSSAGGGKAGASGSSGSSGTHVGNGGSGATGGSSGASGSGGTANDAGDGPEAGTGGSGGTRSGTGGGGGTNAAGSSAAGSAGTASGAGGVSTTHTNPLTQELIDAFVKAHNDARASNLVPTPSPPLPPVTWDAALADTAYNYLSQCTSSNGDLVDHNEDRTQDYAALGGTDYVGENIYASSASSIDPADAVKSWMSEAPNYKPGDVTSAGHYTQVVWRTSVRIGCAIVNCPSVRFHNTVLCDYAPGGNIKGQNPY